MQEQGRFDGRETEQEELLFCFGEERPGRRANKRGISIILVQKSSILMQKSRLRRSFKMGIFGRLVAGVIQKSILAESHCILHHPL